MRVEHGGERRAAAARLGVAPEALLDLSTGISPWSWPVPPLPEVVWRRLPESGDGLESVARRYYGSSAVLAIPGTQAAIQCLPGLRSPCRVVVTVGSYQEHARCWREAGHSVRLASHDGLDAACDQVDVMVVVNPDNPSGRWLSPERLLAWHARLAARGGWLVVDEAFADIRPRSSLAPYAGAPGLIVLRSPGKFFGLAGLRLGFVLAEAAMREAMQHRLGPWAVNHAARWIGCRALADERWQRRQRARLGAAGARLRAALNPLDPGICGTDLFAYIPRADAPKLVRAARRQGVLLRGFDTPPALRIGLPGPSREWRRLRDCLESLLGRGW